MEQTDTRLHERHWITFETWEEWVQVAAYFVWLNGSLCAPDVNWVMGKMQIEEKLRRERIGVRPPGIWVNP